MTVTVTNTGKFAGKEAVQLYVSAPADTMDKPVRELKAFAKTRELKPGESQTITLTVADADLASFDQEQNAWKVEGGNYIFQAGASSRDIRASLETEIKPSVIKVNQAL